MASGSTAIAAAPRTPRRRWSRRGDSTPVARNTAYSDRFNMSGSLAMFDAGRVLPAAGVLTGFPSPVVGFESSSGPFRYWQKCHSDGILQSRCC
jgi:hypothetical protein